MGVLHGKRIVVGVTGSIAAYKAVDFVSKLTQAGALVDVVMTAHASDFVTPLTFSAISQRPVWSNLWEPTGTAAASHIELARSASAFIIVPATADIIARLAHGLADDILTTVALASTAPLIIAPAMETHMLAHPATQANLALLQERGAHIIPPESGRLASGEYGAGRLPSTETLLGALQWVLGQGGDLAGKRIVVTAGGTQEPIDPVRFIGNRSSGLQGFALATAARNRGAEVTVIAGITSLPTPYKVRRVDVTTAASMLAAVLQACAQADILMMAAAVADFTPITVAEHKLKKRQAPAQDGIDLAVELTRTDDILMTLQEHVREFPQLVRIGFAAETREVIAAGTAKLQQKGLAMIVMNDVSEPATGFGSSQNHVWIGYPNGKIIEVPLADKESIADSIWDAVLDISTAQL